MTSATVTSKSLDYESELARITMSGPHVIGEDQRQLNRLVAEEIADILPIDDIHKVSDCDLIYRYLIARLWNPGPAIAGIRAYVAWREDLMLNGIAWEKFPDDVYPAMPHFQGVDVDGNPVFYDRPDPKLAGELLVKYSKDALLRMHAGFMEQGRRLQVMLGKDRMSCVLDMSKCTMSVVTNPSAMSLIKAMSTMDQTYYPENMRTMLVCNGGWTFGGVFKILKPMLDERVQKKIQVIAGGSGMQADIGKFISMDELPVSYGGTAPDGEKHPLLAKNLEDHPGERPTSGFV